jgi:hypothetical protein
MEDGSEDLPKLPRRSAARPFTRPSAEGVTGPLELSRRAAKLFTPPGSSPATPLVDRAGAPEADAPAPIVASDAADGSSEMSAESAHPNASLADASSAESSSEVEFEGDWTPAPLVNPERTLDADSLLETNRNVDDDRLIVEQFEHEEIELTASGSNVPDEHSIEVIAYDDANSLLKAAAADGKHPKVDGLQLETTEFSFEQEPPPPRMNVDSFWASEPFAKLDEPHAATSPVAEDAESRIDEDTAGGPALSAEGATFERSVDEEPVEWADDPSTTISHAQAALEPEPEHDPAPPRESVPMLADISPPWMNRLTPVSSQALEEIKESEPWDLTPAYGLEIISEQPQESAQASQFSTSTPSALDASAADSATGGNGIADALVRIAARVRDGELDVPAGSEMSDEAALSAVLTALLRMRR